MEYKVSEKIQKKFDTLTKDAKVQKALQFMEDDQNEIIDRQIELTLIPAPTNHEQKKAARLLEMFKEEGLTDCHIDEYGNCIGIRKGTGGGKTVLVEGHMDTVFPLDTKLEIVREDGFIKCPGIVDDTRGCATVLSTIRALNAAGIETKGDIQFVGTVQEEGTGALKGMQYYVNHHPELDASISVDGPGFQEITYEATGIQTYEINFHGIGGHACGAFREGSKPDPCGRTCDCEDLRDPGSEGADDHICGDYHAGRKLRGCPCDRSGGTDPLQLPFELPGRA